MEIAQAAPYVTARWCDADSAGELEQFVQAKRASLAKDRDGNPVYLARNNWDLGRVQEDFPKVRFTATRERH
jgi:peptide chain release factor 3